MGPTVELEESQGADDRLPDHDYEDVLTVGGEPERSRLSDYGD